MYLKIILIIKNLIKRNTKSNFTDDQTDIAQQLRIAMMKAGSYYKRQTYIENCLSLCEKYCSKDDKTLELLISLWDKRTKHGANKQKFGPKTRIQQVSGCVFRSAHV